jgi:hypothetical protein
LSTPTEISEILAGHPHLHIKCQNALEAVPRQLDELSAEDMQYVYQVIRANPFITTLSPRDCPDICMQGLRHIGIAYSRSSGASVLQHDRPPMFPPRSMFANGSLLFRIANSQSKLTGIRLDCDALPLREKLEEDMRRLAFTRELDF